MQKGNKLALYIMIGLLAGIIFAFFAIQAGWSAHVVDWVKPFGDIFIRLLKFIAVPMVLFSIITGVMSLGDNSVLGRMGLKTLGMYLTTTVTAVCIGLLVVNLIQPGTYIDAGQVTENRVRYEIWVSKTPGVELLDGKNFLDDPAYATVVAKVRNDLAGENDAANRSESEHQRAKKLSDKVKTLKATDDKGPLGFLVDMVPDNIFKSLANNKLMLQVIFFAIFFGVILLGIDKTRAAPVKQVVLGLNDIFVKMIQVVMYGAPFFVFALLAGTVCDMAGNSVDEMLELFKGLAMYCVAVVVGLAIMAMFIYPLLARLLAHVSVPRFMNGILPAQMMAFSTSSSVATLPVTINSVKKNIGVSHKTTSFVLPIGATVNMDGTSLYQAVAVVFLAQMHGLGLTMDQQLMIVLTATLASIGAAAVPSAGLVLMMAVLESVGLNPAWIAIIFPVDRILDMCRTVVNVTGDATVAAVIAKSEGEKLTPDLEA